MHTAIHTTSLVLRNYLLAQLRAIPALGFGGTRVVSLNSPREMRDPPQQEGLSVWLYRITRDDSRLNTPARRIQPDLIEPPPLPLQLHYLVTPLTFNATGSSAPDTEQQIMGRVLQALHSRPTLRGVDCNGTDFEGLDVELHFHLEVLALDEMSRIWDALEGSYQLSVSYQVSVVNIAALPAPWRVTPVQVALPEYGVMVES